MLFFIFSLYMAYFFIGLIRFKADFIFNPVHFYIFLYVFGFAIVPNIVDDNGSWDKIQEQSNIILLLTMIGLMLGHLLSYVNINLNIRFPAIITTKSIMEYKYLKFLYFLSIIFIIAQIVVRIQTNTLVMGMEPIASNIFISILGYILLLTGMSHTGVVFYSLMSILSIIIFKVTGKKKYIVVTLLIYLSISIITTQKAVFIFSIITLVIFYNCFCKKIKMKYIIYILLSLPVIIVWSVVANYIRWASINDLSYTVTSLWNNLNFSDAIDYFLNRFDFYKSATYALLDIGKYPSDGLLSLLKSTLFFMPYGFLFGNDMFSVKFAQAYSVYGYEQGVGVTVPLMIDVAISYSYLLITVIFVVVGYLLNKWYQFLSYEISFWKLVLACLIPIIYISSATIPLFELLYLMLRSTFFVVLYLTLSRILYSVFVRVT